jgi:hypothetical protein
MQQVFGAYLQLSTPENVGGSAVPMRLNGWQRLWVVAAVLWLLPVAFFTYELWPITSSVHKGDVYKVIEPEDGHRFTDYYELWRRGLGV